MNRERYLIAAFIVLALIVFSISYYGSSDIGDYGDVAKFFSGEYDAKIRSSHSYLFGWIHAPLVSLTNSFIFFKISSLIFLLLLVYSVYFVSGKNKRALWMISLAPVVWYMAPWMNPVQASSVALLWAWHFISKFNSSRKAVELVYSGILIGIGWAVWDTIAYFGAILFICFLYDKKIYYGMFFIISILIGLLPRLILDQYLFGFAFFTTVKTFMSGWANLFGGIYSNIGHTPRTLATVLPFLLAIPVSFWSMFKFKNLKINKRSILFITLSLLLLLANPQVRYILALAPIMIVLASRAVDEREFRISMTFSVFILVLFMVPYITQAFYNSDNPYGYEVTGMLSSGLQISEESRLDLILFDLKEIEKEYPNQIFVVGNHPDNYQVLAHFYWGSGVREFVSIQDYELWMRNESTLYKKRFSPVPRISERRQFWIEGGLKKSDNDPTDYENIDYAIGIEDPVKLDDFAVIKEYRILTLSKKVI